MRIQRIFVQRMRSLFRRSRIETELAREIELHVDALIKENMRSGMSEADARAMARREFGSADLMKERCRDARRVNLVSDAVRDLVYTWRQLRKAPVFALTAIVSLALGIGANTIVFSVLNSLILKPLPVPDPGRIQALNRSHSPANSFPDFRDIRERNAVFESLFGYRIMQAALGENGGASRVWGYLATGNYFESLGVKPALGRFFGPAEDAHLGASPYAVLSYECWKNRFAGAADIAGSTVRVNNAPYTVLGVAPPGFHGTEVFYWPEIWVPITMQAQIEGNPWLEHRNTMNLWVAGRLKPGITADRAEANLKSIAAQLAREHVEDEGMQLTLSEPGLAGSLLRNPTRAFGSAVMLLALLVLLAACANLAGLMTARAADRGRELAIRLSIGAGRGRLVRQLLTESLALAGAGAAAGWGAAVTLLRLLSRWRAPLDFPVQFDVNPDWRVFLFACAAAAITGVLFGIGPASRAWRVDANVNLKGDRGAAACGVWHSRDFLLPVQIAACCVLVTSSFAAARGLARSFETPLGFTPAGVAVAGYDLGLAQYEKTRGAAFQRQAFEAIRALPGVEAAAYSSSVPLSIDQSTTTVYPEATTEFRPKNGHRAIYYMVSPGYFHTVGTTILAGRDLTARDNASSPRVALVNRTLARRVTGSENAAGRRFRQGVKAVVEIVGVVEDGKYETLTEAPKAAVFFPIAQNYSSTSVVLARSRRPEADMAAEMRRAINRLDPGIAVYGAGALRGMLGLVYLPMHAAAIALGSFGVLALMLSLTGIHGLAAYTVSRRTREIGIRMAVGARPAQVLRCVFRRLAVLVGVGALAGIALGVAAGGLLASVVYSANSHDPATVLSAVLAIWVVALAAAFHPARRALGLDPLNALRHD